MLGYLRRREQQKRDSLDVQAIIAYTVGMKRLQYTVRNVTPEIDRGLRQTARKKRQSLNDTLLEALQASLGTLENHDLDFVAGTWIEDPATDKALKDQRKIDKDMWS